MTEPQPRKPFRRRDFLFGAMGGFAASGAAGLLAPMELKAKTLPEGTLLCFGQYGEDLIVSKLFDMLAVSKPSYLDIGAFHPTVGSNTYTLYRQGSRGVLVEPNVDMISALKSKRPGDTVLNVGIGVDATTASDYYVMNYPQLNTFDKDDADMRVRDGEGKIQIKEIVKMPLVNVNTVMAEHFANKAPDFVSTDTEGFDIHILKSFDYKNFRPKIICAETVGKIPFRMEPEITDLLLSKGYEIRAMTVANTIFVDKSLLG
jgi:FkbM family methyltransferase